MAFAMICLIQICPKWYNSLSLFDFPINMYEAGDKSEIGDKQYPIIVQWEIGNAG